jgi:hypothetical protein
LRADLRTTAGSFEPDRALPELQSPQPQGQTIQTDHQEHPRMQKNLVADQATAKSAVISRRINKECLISIDFPFLFAFIFHKI